MAERKGSSPEAPNWLSRLRRRRSRSADGGVIAENVGEGARDVIVGNVGEGARDVIVGKDIKKYDVKIGTVVVPTLPAVVLLLAVLVGAILVAWLYLVPAKMTGKFRVAVAEFGELDAQGRVHSSENGRLLSRWLFDALQRELANLPIDLQPQVWHDSLGLTQKRVTIGIVPGDTPAQRRDAACARAEEIGADVLVYGYVDASQKPAAFSPAFCVRRLRSDTGEVDQIQGSHQLGAPVPVVLPLSDDLRSSSSVNRVLRIRTGALSKLTAGLVYDLNGDSQTALDIFKSVDLEWSEQDRKEIVYYLIGREYLFLRRLDEGRDAFDRALRLNPGFARARLGLGGTYYVRAQDAEPESRLKTDDLDRAIAEYQRALASAREAQDRQAEFQARFALGTAYRLQGEAYLFSGEYQPANASFDLTISEVDAGLKLAFPDQHRLLGLAYLVLGTAYHQKAHVSLVLGDKSDSRHWFTEAEAAYGRCIGEADADPLDQVLREKIRDDSCEPYKKDVEQALANL